MNIKRFIGRAALILAACAAFAGCDQPGASITEPQGGGGGRDLGNWEDAEDKVYMTGIEIASPPDITLYPQSFQPQDIKLEGLAVYGLYSDGTAELLPDSDYEIDTSELTAGPGYAVNKPVTVRKTVYEVTRTEETQTITMDGENYTNTYVQVSTKNVQAEDSFLITIAKDNRVLERVTLTGALPSAQDLGAAFSMGNVSVTGHYSDNTSEPLDAGLCKVTGYDPRKRGPQTVTVKVNGITALSNFAVTTQLPAGATVKPIAFQVPVLSPTGSEYRQVYLKGEAFSVEKSGLRVEAVIGGKTALLTHANGGLLDSDAVTYKGGGVLSGGKLDRTGRQTLSLALDNGKTAEFEVYVASVEPQVYFDYGFRRTAADPDGKGFSGGKYYVKKGQSIELAPIRYLIGYKADHTPGNVSYSWTVNGASSVTTETFAFAPASAGTYTVQVSVTGRNFLTGNTDTKTATTQVVCFDETPVTNTDGLRLLPGEKLKDFAPGQFTTRGNGYGWSLGAALGYEMWGVPDGTLAVRIAGNGFGGWNEPGVVWTQADENGNGIPDEEWVEHKGGDDDDPTYKNKILRRHAITYYRGSSVCWVDSRGRMGVMYGGWPSATGQTEKGITAVQGDWITYTGTVLRDGGGAKINDGTLNGGSLDIGSGYVDSYNPADGQWCAVRAPAGSSIRFVKVQTAYFNYGGVFGEHSTEIVRSDPGFTDQSGGFPNPLN